MKVTKNTFQVIVWISLTFRLLVIVMFENVIFGWFQLILFLSITNTQHQSRISLINWKCLNACYESPENPLDNSYSPRICPANIHVTIQDEFPTLIFFVIHYYFLICFVILFFLISYFGQICDFSVVIGGYKVPTIL